jgi:hypothetical protein
LIETLPSTAFAGSHPSPPATEVLRAFIGKARTGKAGMSQRERTDMAIVTILFGVLVAAFGSFSLLINQIFVRNIFRLSYHDVDFLVGTVRILVQRSGHIWWCAYYLGYRWRNSHISHL